MTAARRLAGMGGTALFATAVMAVAAASILAAAPGGGAPWAAYAQAPVQTVQVGALMTNATGQEFNDPARIAAVQYAVDRFNAQSADLRLNLTIAVIERGQEPARLVEAYGGGSGPAFYIGPTTSEGLANIRNDSASSAILDDVVLVSPSSEAPSLALDDNIFRIAVNVVRQGNLLVGEMDSAGIGSYVAVYRDDSWGRQLESAAGAAASRTGIDRLAAIPFEASPTAADWAGIAGQIEGHATGPEKIGVFFMGYDDTYAGMSAAANASAALRQSTAWFATSGTPVGTADGRIVEGAMRDFSAAVGLTALREDVPDNAVNMAVRANLTGEGVAMPGFYEYSTYDSVFILGNAMRMASGAGEGAISAAAVSDAMPLAAMEYARAALGGDILLDGNGDLRTPDRFTVRTANSTGHWVDGSATYTPVATIGALVGLGYEHYPDDKTLEAVRQAAVDYNADSRTSLVKLVAYNITGDIVRNDTRAALARAHDGGAGPSVYVGPTLSESLAPMMDYADDNGVILFSPGSEAETLAMAGDNTFRMAVSTDKHGRFMGQVMADTGIGAAVTVVLDDEWGRSLNASISRELAASGAAVGASISFPPGGAQNDWAAIVSDVAAAIRAQASAGPVGVAFVGTHDDQNLLAAAASGSPDNATLGGVQWFVTPSGVIQEELNENPAARTFAVATNMTGIVNGVEEDSDRRAALDSRVQGLSFYEYAAYDTLFVLGEAIRSNVEAGVDNSAANLRAAVPVAAEAYVGVLGDIALNSKGDLLTPDRFVVRVVDSTGQWVDTDVTKSTPVFDIGALMLLDGNPVYNDDLELAAMRAAAADFNEAREAAGDFYVNLAVQRISISPDDDSSPDPDALAGLTAAYDNGSGPSYYIGPSTSGNAERVLGYANANDIVLISHSSTAPLLAVPGDNLFRMVVPDGLQGDVLGNLIDEEEGVTHLVMAVRNDTWGRGVDEKTAAFMGDDVDVARVSFAESGEDWAAFAARLNASVAAASASAGSMCGGAAGVLFIGFDGDFVSMAPHAAAYQQLKDVMWFGPDGIGNSATITANATAVAFANATDMRTVVYSVAPNDVNERLDPRAVYGPSAYDSVQVMGSAIRAAYGGGGEAPTGPAVRDEIPGAAQAYAGALGNVTLDANGDLASPSTYAIYRMNTSGMWAHVHTVDAVDVARVDCSDESIRCITIAEVHTEEFAALTRTAHYAHEIAVEDFNREQNAAGGGQRVHLDLERASVCLRDPVAGLREAYDDGAGPSAYLGPMTSYMALQLKDYIDDNGIVLVSMASASNPVLTKPDTLFRVSLNDRYEADLIVIAAERENVTTIIPVIRDDPYGHSYEDEARNEAALLGMEVLDPVLIEPGQSNLSATARDLNASVSAAIASVGDPSKVGLLVAAFNPDMHNLAHYAIEYPALMSVNWFNPGTLHPPIPLADPETLHLAQNAPLFSTSWELPQDDELDRIHDIFRAEFGHEPNQFAYAAYDSVFILADAINRSMAADGSYTAADVAANMPTAARGVDRILGPNFDFDANGDRVSPSTVVVWKSTPGTGAWAEADRVHLPSMCEVGLASEKLEFGGIRPGATSDARTQAITASGTIPIDTLEIGADPWVTASGGTALPAGATEARSADDSLGAAAAAGGWVNLATAKTMGEQGGDYWWSLPSVEFRVNAPASVPQGAAGEISQTITYAAECVNPY